MDKGVIHMPLTFLVNGREVTAEQFQSQAEKKKPKPVREQKGYHKGFRVVGHAPGAMEEAKRDREDAIQTWNRDRAGKMPKTWDEASWRRNTKKTALRSKPYEIYEAAELCADMARQDGWEDVEIIEVKKEVRNDSFMA